MAVLAGSLELFGSMTGREWTYFTNPGTIAIVISIFSVYHERSSFREFIIKKIAEKNDKEIQIQHNSMSTMLNAINESAFLMKADGTILFANTTVAERFGKNQNELIGSCAFDLIPADVRTLRMEMLDKSLNTKKPVRFIDERFGRSIDNIIYPVIDNGEVIYFAIYGIDITDRIGRIKEIERLLNEKNMLLKEVHHRIKNHMSSVADLLSIGAGMVTDVKSKSIFQDMNGRILAMMRLYDRLYRSEKYSSVNLDLYIKDLTQEIIRSYIDKGLISIDIDVEPLQVTPQIISCVGIVINELITNSIKYAFPDNRKGVIGIKVYKNRDDEFSLMVSDNGVGMQPRNDKTSHTGFGLTLVNMLVDQCKGSMTISQDGGTTFLISMPMTNK